jgi:hypothetical protein
MNGVIPLLPLYTFMPWKGITLQNLKTNELEWIWKERVVAQFALSCQYLPGRTEKNNKRKVRLAPDLAGVKNGPLPNASQKHYPLGGITTHNKFLIRV